jgi:hypothetical protein
MPGPTTEVLNEDMRLLRIDVTELKRELHQVEVDLRTEIHKVEAELKADIQEVKIGLARLQTEVGLARWLIGLTLLATLSGIGSGIWWAATVTSELRTISSRNR